MSAIGVYLAAYKQMGLQAYTIGDRDLGLGLKTLRSVARKASFPLLSSNVVHKDSGAKVFKGHTIIRKAGFKIAVIGATTSLFVNRNQLEESDNIKVIAPEESVAKEIKAAKAKGAQLFVLLGHLNESEVERTVRSNPEIQFVLGGQWVKMDSRAKKVGNAWVVGAYMRGKNLSVMDLYVQNKSLEFVDRNARQQLIRQQRTLESRIKGRERSIESARKDPKRKSSVEYLERNLVQLKTELQEVSLDLEDLVDPASDASYIKWDLRGMDTGFSDEKRVAKLVTAHRAIYPDPTKKPRNGKAPKPALKTSRTPKPTVRPKPGTPVR